MLKWIKSLFSKKTHEVPVEVPPVIQQSITLQDLIMEIMNSQVVNDSGGRIVPFTLAENYSQVQYEMESIEIESEHWSDRDYLEQLLAFLNQGYKFEGLETLYKKVNEGKDLTEVERKQIQNWYMLANMEVVYDV